LTGRYVSSDLLTGHAVAGSMRRVMELHDPARFELALYIVNVIYIYIYIYIYI
jgi:predicted O-linked N-acetylglucosamine transferase (SPINDLY family)